MDRQTLQSRLNYANKRAKFAWFKYYEAVNERHTEAYTQYTTLTATVVNDCVPTHIKNLIKDMSDKLKSQWECAICLEFIPDKQLDITSCGHFFCKSCLDKLKEHSTANTKDSYECPSCRRKITIKSDE